MHGLGVMHRDLKPANIMVMGEGSEESVKLLDFGIATHVIESVTTHKLYGTPAYMAPEQARTMRVDGRADQFSLACVLYEMITGRRPWRTSSWDQAVTSVRRQRPPRPPSRMRQHPMVHAEFDAVLLRALEMDPADRWEDMEAFTFALRMALGLQHESSESDSGAEQAFDDQQLAELESIVALISEEEQDNAMTTIIANGTQGDDTSATITLGFRSQERLEKEWTQRLHRGDLFVPCNNLLPLGSRTRLRMIFEPEHLVLELEGEVIAHQARPAGDGSTRRHDPRLGGRNAACASTRQQAAWPHRVAGRGDGARRAHDGHPR